MAQKLPINSNINSSHQVPIFRTAKPSNEFYKVFSEAEILGIIHALESRREIPLKYSYKGQGAKIWDSFYLKYIVPTWYRTSNVEIDLLKSNFAYLNGDYQQCDKVNIIDVGAGNAYPVKAFIGKLKKLGRIDKYIALDISDELLNVSSKNFKKWFPLIDYINHDRHQVFQHFRDSMAKNDLLVFTNEIGSNSQWDGIARGGCKYHADQVYRWITNNLGMKAEDCELVRKYDPAKDSIVANLKLQQNYTINFSYLGIDKSLEISAGEEITIWRHHKFEIPTLIQEIEQAGLKLVNYSTNKYSSHLMVICEASSNNA